MRREDVGNEQEHAYQFGSVHHPFLTMNNPNAGVRGGTLLGVTTIYSEMLICVP
jgi:hypothetical protein